MCTMRGPARCHLPAGTWLVAWHANFRKGIASKLEAMRQAHARKAGYCRLSRAKRLRILA